MSSSRNVTTPSFGAVTLTSLSPSLTTSMGSPALTGSPGSFKYSTNSASLDTCGTGPPSSLPGEPPGVPAVGELLPGGTSCPGPPSQSGPHQNPSRSSGFGVVVAGPAPGEPSPGEPVPGEPAPGSGGEKMSIRASGPGGGMVSPLLMSSSRAFTEPSFGEVTMTSLPWSMTFMMGSIGATGSPGSFRYSTNVACLETCGKTSSGAPPGAPPGSPGASPGESVAPGGPAPAAGF
mmetsp:Transcript_83434/g.193955  ORF Transcript_83434/g.193955 Transcript_83434/m.193955 type:complete len:234 (-) Transcript_83434:1481-2182(-)